MNLNGKKIDKPSLEIDGVDSSDYPDFSDAYFSAAFFTDGEELTEEELQELTESYPEELNEMAFEHFMN